MTAVRSYNPFKIVILFALCIWMAAVFYAFILAIITPVYTAEDWQATTNKQIKEVRLKYETLAEQGMRLNRIEYELREIEEKLGRIAAIPIVIDDPSMNSGQAPSTGLGQAGSK